MNKQQDSPSYCMAIMICVLFILCFLFFYSSVSSAQDKIVYDAQSRRDPFMALVTPDGRLINLEPASGETKIVIGGIIYDENGSSYAIINGEVVSIDDYILGYTVSSIEENKVTLLKDDQQTEYILEKEEP